MLSSDVSDLSLAVTDDSTGDTSLFLLSLGTVTRVVEVLGAEGRVTVLLTGAVVLRVKVPLTRVLVTALTVLVLARSCVLLIDAVLSMRCRLLRAGASLTGVAVTLAVESRGAVLEGNSAD